MWRIQLRIHRKDEIAVVDDEPGIAVAPCPSNCKLAADSPFKAFYDGKADFTGRYAYVYGNTVYHNGPGNHWGRADLHHSGRKDSGKVSKQF